MHHALSMRAAHTSGICAQLRPSTGRHHESSLTVTMSLRQSTRGTSSWRMSHTVFPMCLTLSGYSTWAPYSTRKWREIALLCDVITESTGMQQPFVDDHVLKLAKAAYSHVSSLCLRDHRLCSSLAPQVHNGDSLVLFSTSPCRVFQTVICGLEEEKGNSRTMTSNVPALQSRVLNAPMTPAELFRTLRSCDISQISPDQNHQYIQDAQRDVDLLENDMELLENHIRRLRTRQAVLKRDILQYGSLESPIRKLPVEVLRLIFRFTSKQSIFGIDREWMSTAFCLSSVCSRWREVSLNSPELWADVGFSIDEEKALKPVLISLNRSQDYPLTVHIAGEDEDGQKFQAFLALSIKTATDCTILTSRACPGKSFKAPWILSVILLSCILLFARANSHMTS
ncbi:hypothetical protein PM082_015344 [Marasmius tenuissimus]|nr:hypothetical protein PM082_015344 [Marasmius tenuissimus]